MDVKSSFFNVMLKAQKDSGDISAGVDLFLIPLHKNFVRNSTSKLARSTLTLPGIIRVKRPEKDRPLGTDIQRKLTSSGRQGSFPFLDPKILR